ncbi:hypothetical protein [Polaromonas sp.]|uniref:hypothetical protein n=1 Tax=Polaromonas sp. TaxID=1869339 RepID=UPI0017ADC853|nr:hypothetical protein [Polaromonas sp.]NML84893.1 hypothetical protein [Polaromonas sp.]
MEFLTLAMLIAVGAFTLKSRDERRRIALLGSHLGKYQIEKLMENLTEGYMRALGEKDPERREQVWRQMSSSETKLCDQFNRFVADFSKVEEADARVSTLAFPLPYAARLLPAATFDLRKVLLVHAQGVTNAATNSLNRSAKNKAYTMSAELLLMQHSCHWFCKSRAVASARMMVRHKTSYEQLLASVAPETRKAYDALTGS